MTRWREISNSDIKLPSGDFRMMTVNFMQNVTYLNLKVTTTQPPITQNKCLDLRPEIILDSKVQGRGQLCKNMVFQGFGVD